MQNEGKKNKTKKCQNLLENKSTGWTNQVCLSGFPSKVQISTDILFQLEFPQEEELSLTFPSRSFG